MTEPEIPDSLGFLFGGLTESGAGTEKNKTTPDALASSSASAPAERPFPSRRELRAQREAAERAAAAGLADAPVAAEAAAPVATPAPSVAAPAEIVPTPAQSAEAVLAQIVGDQPAAAEIAAAPAVPAAPAEVRSHAESAIPAARPTHVESAAPLVVATSIDPVAATPATASIEIVTPAVVAATATAVRDRRVKRTQGVARAAAARTSSSTSAGSSFSKPAKRGLRQRITATGTMLLVGGIFASLALPAYAFDDEGKPTAATQAALEGDTQKLSVAADVAQGSVGRDAYGVTKAADLRALYANALRQKNLEAYMASGAKAQGDDYPYATDLTRNEGGGLSPFRYYYRECVDFVAWRLNRDQGVTQAPWKWDWSNLTPNGGNASQWKSAWQAHGWPTGNTPEVGAVAWFNYNHVAYVSGILADGSVVLEEYNMGGKHQYGQRVLQVSEIPLFLYAPPA
ncbi:CHAP domain-containing protein [Schumannella soli]|uniref:CHAP domain-containing protein n=1 Tax=Schumannella soli TaxID=2590779 RepID=A0A506Y0T6_9MICO|nr:CHAP domain-containing protein [Schumannella soli]TPW75572.1 CHAP domain-containing protein [Schumannella soli]